MWKFILLTCLWMGTSRSQLNYDGNPLTENIDYAAEESHYLPRENVEKSREFIPTNDKRIDSYLEAVNILNQPNNGTHIQDIKSIASQYPESIVKIQTPVILNSFNQSIIVTNRAKLPRQLSSDPLDNFLNSRTPEESQLALDSYLKSRQQPEPMPLNQNLQIDNYKPLNAHQETKYLINEKKINSLDNFKNDEAQLHGGSMIHQENEHMINSQAYQPHPLSSVWPQMVYQSRVDTLPPALGPRRRAIHHIRGLPRYRNRFAQSRIGPNFIHQPPIFHGNDKPIEVIHTKPPEFNNPPGVPYEDASSYFPEADHPPINKDVYYSQLWAQSYDPNYYKYIAKTGKIKPWLYGKLGASEEKGFWHELYLNFKKHGMRNMMNPMFLLGLSIPALTIMLSALVSKRSFARSIDHDSHLSEERITEIAERVRSAIECYKLNDSDCWKWE